MQALQDLGHDWPVLSELLDAALALPAAARPAWLAGLAPQHARLEPTLRRLLDLQADVETGSFLVTLPPLPAAVHGPVPDEPSPGQQVGPYRLLAAIGQGGMGTVWRAERIEGERWQTGRPVALKLPRLAWGGALAERLARERDILATLDHPHIARLLDAGVDHHQRPYLAMEFIDGLPIDRHCAAQDSTLRHRIELLLQVAAAVAHAHARLVVHRDLKPANILVSADGQVHLLDFGIAKLLEGETTAETVLTQVGGRAFTPQYASPEQVRGEPLTTASDVYSLGVVAYELLAGSLPYRLRRGSAAEIEAAIDAGDAPLASAQAADRATRQALRGDLDAILNRALKRSAGERYASVTAFADDLERHLRREPVLARPDSRSYRVRKFVQRHLAAVLAGSALVLSLLAGGGVAVWQARVAQAQAARAESEVDRQEAVRNMYIQAMANLSSRVASDPSVLADPLAVTRALRDTLQEMAPRFTTLPGQWQAMQDAVMVQLNYASDFEGSLAVGLEYLQHLKTHGAPAAEVITTHTSLGRTLFQLNRVDESEAMRRAGVAWAPEVRDPRTTAIRLNLVSDLGLLLSNRGRRSEALQVLTQGEQTAARLLPDSLVRPELTSNLAAVHSGFDDAASLHFARQAVAQDRASSGPPPEDRAARLSTLGSALLANGLAAEAEPVLVQAHPLYVQVFGETNRSSLGVLARWALALSLQGRHEEARTLVARQRAGLASQESPAAHAARRRLDLMDLVNAHFEGDIEATMRHVGAADGSLPPGLRLRDVAFWMAQEVAALEWAGRPADSQRLAESLRRAWSADARPTQGSIRLDLAAAQAQLAAGDLATARQSALQLANTLRQHAHPANWSLRVANELGALASARAGDVGAALQTLALIDARAVAPSAVELAESLLRQAEVRAAAGQVDAAQASGRAALDALKFQHPASPRLARARLAAGLASAR